MSALPSLFLPLFLFLLLPHASQASHVLDLTPLTLDKHLSTSTSSKPLLLEFYAPWCRHCATFAPSYAQTASTLGSSATVARVDGHAYKLLSLRFRVRAFPTFFLIVDGRVFDFHGKRTPEALVSFVRSKGAEAGKPHPYFFGPLGPYWTVVGAGFRALNALYNSVRKEQVTTANVVAFATIAALVVLFAFVVVIYFITMPPPYKPTPPQPVPDAAAPPAPVQAAATTPRRRPAHEHAD